MLQVICRSAGVLAVGAVLLLASVAAEAGECRVRESPCVATVSTSHYTDLPTIPCPNGSRVLEIVVNIDCIASVGGGPSGGGTTTYRCSTLAHPIVINDGTNTHTLQPKPGFTWGDIHSGQCKALAYKIS